jgi:uncharacterized protein (DUF1800 family)
MRLPADQPLLLAILAELGQVPFAPPSVGGWPQNQYWLSTAAAMARLRFAAALVARADLSPVADEAPAQRPEAVGHLLSIDTWSSATASALARVADDPRALTGLALVSPEYVSN